MVAFQAVDPGSIPGRRILGTSSYIYTDMLPLYAHGYNHIQFCYVYHKKIALYFAIPSNYETLFFKRPLESRKYKQSIPNKLEKSEQITCTCRQIYYTYLWNKSD